MDDMDLRNLRPDLYRNEPKPKNSYKLSATCGRGMTNELAGHLDIYADKVRGNLKLASQKNSPSSMVPEFFRNSTLEFEVYGHIHIPFRNPNSQSLIFTYSYGHKFPFDLFEVSIPGLSQDLSGTYYAKCLDIGCRVWESQEYEMRDGLERYMPEAIRRMIHPLECPSVDQILVNSANIKNWPKRFDPSLYERIFKRWKWSDETITLKLIDEPEREQEY